MILRVRAVLAVIISAALMLGVPVVATAEEAVVETNVMLPATPEPDGTAAELDLTLMTTDPEQPRPVVVLAHGFGGSKADSRTIGQSLAREGYAVITFTARGFGASGGRIHLNNPKYEGADASLIIDWAAKRPEVQSAEVQSGDRDPVIGFAGGSYGGALSLLAAGLDDRVDAIAPAYTYNSLTQALFPQYVVSGDQTSPAQVDRVASTGVFKKQWAALFFGSAGQAGGGGDDGEVSLCGRFTSELCAGYTQTAQTGVISDSLIDVLAESDLGPQLSEINAPTLLVQGENDTLFPLDHADANLRGISTSTPVKMEWTEGGHDSEIVIDDLLPDLLSWFGRYLKRDGTEADTAFEYSIPSNSVIAGDEDNEPEVRRSDSYPGRDSEYRTRSDRLVGDPVEQSVISPPGGTPAALTSLPGTGGALATASGAAGQSLAVLPGQSATFQTQPLAEPYTLVGSSQTSIIVTSRAGSVTLFASLWDIGPSADSNPGRAILPQSAVAPIKIDNLTPGEPTEVRIALPSVVHHIAADHRLQLALSSTDQAYAVPDDAAVYTVRLGDGTLTLPDVPGATLSTPTLRLPVPLLIVVSALVLGGLVALLILWLRARGSHIREDLRQTPLTVEQLVKTYRGGFRAVDGVTFRAEPGQVVGLLGPNGAGKTTTMRMMVGLIRPDSGQVYVRGEPVNAGADVLASVGAFIEGPGFLPHLTGMQNLTAYWQATGRPMAESYLKEALDIAGLGSAIDRQVRGYSQGMRQRLGIAQAMLGKPDLLLLDEPTNGLDPPQIKAMRAVLADYAATGRTVVVSSHLLAEVEQTCSHVVVMDKGKVVLTGSIEELTRTEDITAIGLASDSDYAGAVSLLERAGFRIESVHGHRQLEDVFMTLVGAGESDD